MNYRFASISLLCCLVLFSSNATAANPPISASDYISSWKDEAIFQMAENKIPASITLAQAMLESGNGNSRLATDGNNHFGIKCHGDWTGPTIKEDDETKGECFRKYNDARESFEDHSDFLKKPRYATLFNLSVTDYRGWAKGLKECGYATNPKYPQLLIKLIEENNLHEFDKIGVVYVESNSLPDRHSPTPILTSHSKKNPRSKMGAGATDKSKEITISANRSIQISQNNIQFTVAKDGETVESIARDLDLHPMIVRKFNDFDKNHKVMAGDVVYTQPKRNRCNEDSYRVQQGDSPRSISQKFGVKMKKVCRWNHVSADQELAPGSKVNLKRNKVF